MGVDFVSPYGSYIFKKHRQADACNPQTPSIPLANVPRQNRVYSSSCNLYIEHKKQPCEEIIKQ